MDEGSVTDTAAADGLASAADADALADAWAEASVLGGCAGLSLPGRKACFSSICSALSANAYSEVSVSG